MCFLIPINFPSPLGWEAFFIPIIGFPNPLGWEKISSQLVFQTDWDERSKKSHPNGFEKPIGMIFFSSQLFFQTRWDEKKISPWWDFFQTHWDEIFFLRMRKKSHPIGFEKQIGMRKNKCFFFSHPNGFGNPIGMKKNYKLVPITVFKTTNLSQLLFSKPQSLPSCCLKGNQQLPTAIRKPRPTSGYA